MVVCFGTRPEWLKIKPVYENMKCKILFTGQHQDLVEGITPNMSMTIDTSSNRLDSIISSCITNFPDFQDTMVMVQGDTASAYGCALAAFHRGKTLIHLEAGLRTYEKTPWPEEGYRQMISRIADINLCPTSRAMTNLLNESVSGECFVTGNTILDNINPEGTYYGNTVLVTMHRRENQERMQDWFEEINKVAKDLDFILPIHPSLNRSEVEEMLSNVRVVDPVPHPQLIDIIKRCRFVITDSGGIQEECAFLNKKAIVCRVSTERQEGVDSGHLVLCPTPEEFADIYKTVYTDYEIDKPCPFGNGQANRIIKDILTR